MKVEITTYLALRREAWSRLAGAAVCLGTSAFTPYLLALGLYLAWRSRVCFSMCKYCEEKATITPET